ncbi:MAG: hypothetical protein AAFP19_04905 [Bacteroidota bacterium]
MNTIKIFPLILTVLVTLSLFTSCKKDKDTEAVENIVGIWKVADGTATVFDQGDQLFTVEIETTGTMEFKADQSGRADLTMYMAILEETESLNTTFNWQKEDSEIVFSDDSRWMILKDEKDRQEVSFVHQDSDDPELEVVFELVLERE